MMLAIFLAYFFGLKYTENCSSSSRPGLSSSLVLGYTLAGDNLRRPQMSTRRNCLWPKCCTQTAKVRGCFLRVPVNSDCLMIDTTSWSVASGLCVNILVLQYASFTPNIRSPRSHCSHISLIMMEYLRHGIVSLV